jgi:MSHA biogenesis protein MshQ
MLYVTGAPTVKVTPGQTYNITIPTDANPTVFIAGDSTTIADYGRSGTNGVGGVGGTEANSTGDQKSAGGAGLGYGSPITSYGGPGGGAGGGWDSWSDGNNGAGYIGGAGGDDGGGAGGDGGTGNGKNGVAPGGGGGGAQYGFLTKGTGAPGRIVLSWETPKNISICTTQ